MGCLIECYHRQTVDHLDGLLQNVRSSRSSFVLMNWILNTYLSPDLLGNPELQEMDPIKEVDLLLFSELAEKAKIKLIENVKKEVKSSLENILQNDRGGKTGKDELYVDTIQCIHAMPTEARKISQQLSYYVQEACFQELTMFLANYTAEKAKEEKPEIKDLFKTLMNCKELKHYIQTTDKKTSPFNEAVAHLDRMEAFTLKLLKEIVADMAENHLKKYFKSDNKEFFHLLHDVKSRFSELPGSKDVQMKVMEDSYKLIAHVYLKHLIQSSRRKLMKNWSPEVGLRVAEDAELLHETFSELAPGVREWNGMLLKVKELYEDKSFEAMKMTAASIQNEYHTWSEDLKLLPALLKWKGLSRQKIREVEIVLEDVSDYQPRFVPACSCFTS
ncbi:exocyst complex component 3 [Cottoperca gobio]|uniref:Exocyst complex component 3 n=1 Tax=Cottoperca gobio TaxID=56716 RepID=A0A6J2S553_COTGO|nr:exocyst complex component 3-like [Cottoperca gobio]